MVRVWERQISTHTYYKIQHPECNITKENVCDVRLHINKVLNVHATQYINITFIVKRHFLSEVPVGMSV